MKLRGTTRIAVLVVSPAGNESAMSAPAPS
jgi:hypothetical protein